MIIENLIAFYETDYAFCEAGETFDAEAYHNARMRALGASMFLDYTGEVSFEEIEKVYEDYCQKLTNLLEERMMKK